MATTEVLLLLRGFSVKGEIVSSKAYPGTASEDAKRLGCAVDDLLLLRDVTVYAERRHLLTPSLAVRRSEILAIGQPEFHVPDGPWAGA